MVWGGQVRDQVLGSRTTTSISATRGDTYELHSLFPNGRNLKTQGTRNSSQEPDVHSPYSWWHAAIKHFIDPIRAVTYSTTAPTTWSADEITTLVDPRREKDKNWRNSESEPDCIPSPVPGPGFLTEGSDLHPVIPGQRLGGTAIIRGPRFYDESRV